MVELPVKKLPNADSGRQLVRLNHHHREGITRYGIAKITNKTNGKELRVLMLGHNDRTAIYMPYDIRNALGVDPNEKLSFKLARVGWIGKLQWYLTAVDPAVHIPARVALGGVGVGLLGVVVGFLSLF